MQMSSVVAAAAFVKVRIASQKSGIPVQLELLPFLLNPNKADDDDEPLQEHLAKKYGAAAARNILDPHSGYTKMGLENGIVWNNDRRMYSTKKVHALMEYVKESKGNEQVNLLMEKIYKGYCENAVDISSDEVLVGYATEVGVSAVDATYAIMPDRQAYILKKCRSIKSTFEVSSVPYFMIEQNSKNARPVTFSGAGSIDSIAERLTEAARV